MKSRAVLGAFIWVSVFYLVVSIIAYTWSVSWAILILCLRHILLEIPAVYEIWRKVVAGEDEYSRMSRSVKNWPTRSWYLTTLLCILLSVVSFLWLNVPLNSYF
jgi:hypothetical protein